MSSCFGYAFDNAQEADRSALPDSQPQQSFGPEIILFCETCRTKTRHICIAGIVRLLGIGHSTTYYWMKKGWVHWQELPRGYRFICRSSLSQPMQGAKAVTPARETGPANKRPESGEAGQHVSHEFS